MTVQCCCCGKVRIGPGEWEVVAAKREEPISHTYCGPCLEHARHRLSAYRAISTGAALAALVSA